ncbi:MAG: hypothetical protein EPO37_01855 [Nitrosarchaeum sp.]|nr:MAG: hypothetical protein EPO37_01855 [Nitrosarchaeum sp.]
MNMENIAIRAYTIPKQAPKKYPYFGSKPFFDRVIVIHCDAKSDYYQNLTTGYFEIYQNNILEEYGFFYGEISAKELEALKQNSVPVYSIEEFRKIFLYESYNLKTLCVGFDLPFILTRLCINATPARLHKKDGFSLLFTDNLNYPRLHITHGAMPYSFIEWGTTKSVSANFKGYFVDLRTLAYCLTDTIHTFESACKSFKVPCMDTNQNYFSHINRVKTSFQLYCNAKKEFEEYDLPIPITRAYTPASIAKAILQKIGVQPFLKQNPDFSKEIIGYSMNGFFGGRAECKIRKTFTLVDELDFLASYCTTSIIQNLWKYVIAESIEFVDFTVSFEKLLNDIKLEDTRNPKFWSKMQGIALIIPDNDVLPIRAPFSQKHAWNIGVETISCKTPLWYCYSDIVFSKLKTGKTPRILKAYSFVPKGIQKNLDKITLHGITIDPNTQDPFLELVEYRQKLKKIRDYFEKDHPQYSYYDRLQNIIKIISNAISYGIFIEITTSVESEPIPVDVYGITSFTQEKTHLEKAGLMFNPIIANSITSGLRLMLGIAEIILDKHNSTHAYCDTDSMFVPPQHAKEIQEFFQPLSPYSFDSPIFKLEKSNKLFFGISTKRYALCDMDNDKIIIDDEKYSGHSLGHLVNPFYDNSDTWYKQIWQDILDLHHDIMEWSEFYEKYHNKYAMQKLVLTSPEYLKWFSKINSGKDYFHQIKPFNTVILGFSNGVDPDTELQIRPIAPYIEPARHAVFEKCIDYNSGKKIRGKQYWKTLTDEILEYMRNPELKLDGNDGVLCRKNVTVSQITHIGKESNNLDKVQIFGADLNSYVTYEDNEYFERRFVDLTPRILKLKPKDVKKFGISRQTLWNVKQNILERHLEKISNKIKSQFLQLIL